MVDQNKTATPVRLLEVSKRFRDVIAVDKINLDVEAGALVTLLGPSGCGKTTTLRMIAGLERVTAGRIYLDSEEITKLPANLRDVTMVFQNYALFPHMNVFENVAYGLRVGKRPQDEIGQRVQKALSMVGLQGLEVRAPKELSGGQQQRVALARALVMQPKVLLFDEPLSNLDAKLRRRVRDEIRELQQRLGITSIYVTHDQEEALAISDVIVVMNQGKIEQIGSPQALYTKPANRFVADFVGSANFLQGTFDGKIVSIGDYHFAHRQEVSPGEVIVMVRPEAVLLSSGAEEGLRATMKSTAYLGSETDILFETPAGEIFATFKGEGKMRFEKGDPAMLRFKPAGVHLLAADVTASQVAAVSE